MIIFHGSTRERQPFSVLRAGGGKQKTKAATKEKAPQDENKEIQGKGSKVP